MRLVNLFRLKIKVLEKYIVDCGGYDILLRHLKRYGFTGWGGHGSAYDSHAAIEEAKSILRLQGLYETRGVIYKRGEVEGINGVYIYCGELSRDEDPDNISICFVSIRRPKPGIKSTEHIVTVKVGKDNKIEEIVFPQLDIRYSLSRAKNLSILRLWGKE